MMSLVDTKRRQEAVPRRSRTTTSTSSTGPQRQYPPPRCCGRTWGLVLLLLLARGATGTPFSPEDNFEPACGGLLPDPPPGGWKLWSDPGTWGGGPVPGVGAAAGGNATVPCGLGVLLDVPRVNLTLLSIQGALKLKDDPELPLISLAAAFIVVEGRFIIGSASQQFQHRAEITLTPNPLNRQVLNYTAREPADPDHPRPLGHKAFAVVGGQVDFHGLPGPADMPVWTKLAKTVTAGSSSITVQGDASSWPVGSPVGIAPTDYHSYETEAFNITAVSCATGSSTCDITLDGSFVYNHYGDAYGVPDGFGGYVDETGEVALLTRNIVVTGTDEGGEFALEGGHFIVFFTNTPQVLEGVEFLRMGQQGQLGRYNIHFHVCGDQAGKSTVRKNLVIHSKQRCVVAHATFNLHVEANVAFNTSGHCFMVEEGGETGNVFQGNLGILTRMATNKISDEETDDTPATFWISNPNNSYIGNAAAGSEGSGFWLELRAKVRGISAIWPRLNNTVPTAVDTVGTMAGNAAHSNYFAGFQGYPKGYKPRANATQANPDGDGPVWVEFGNFKLWKNLQVGAFLHGMDHIVFSSCTLADNSMGIQIKETQAINVTGHTIVGHSANTGSAATAPPPPGTSSMSRHSLLGRMLRGFLARDSTMSGGTVTASGTLCRREWATGLYGVLFYQNRQYEDGSATNILTNSTFSAFDRACGLVGAIGVGANRKKYWNAGQGFQGVRFDTSPWTPTNPIILRPRYVPDAGGLELENGGEVSTMFALHDFGRTLLGVPGYVVANNTELLPPASSGLTCTPSPASNAYFCPGTCYRSVEIIYDEPGFEPYLYAADPTNNGDGPRKLGDYSYVQIRRTVDGVTMTLEGNLRLYANYYDNGQAPLGNSSRTFAASLLANQSYEVTLVPPSGNASFVPREVQVRFKDGGGCGQGLGLGIKASTAGQYTWELKSTDPVQWVPCSGNSALAADTGAPVTASYSCSTDAAPSELLQLAMSGDLPPAVPVIVRSLSPASGACGASSRCGLTAAQTQWLYNDKKEDLGEAYPGGPAFFNPLFATPSPPWAWGRGVLGYSTFALDFYYKYFTFVWAPQITTTLSAPTLGNQTTYYFRRPFNVSDSACYTVLYLDFILQGDVVLYLNNVEVLRASFSAGYSIASKAEDGPNVQSVRSAQAVVSRADEYGAPPAPEGDAKEGYVSFQVPLTGAGVNYSLTEGVNYLAAEVTQQPYNAESADLLFGLSVSTGPNNPSCSGAKVTAEVCDGIDNDYDGQVDVDPSSGVTLQRPCSGGGMETCLNGAYQNCTLPGPAAPPPPAPLQPLSPPPLGHPLVKSQAVLPPPLSSPSAPPATELGQTPPVLLLGSGRQGALLAPPPASEWPGPPPNAAKSFALSPGLPRIGRPGPEPAVAAVNPPSLASDLSGGSGVQAPAPLGPKPALLGKGSNLCLADLRTSFLVILLALLH